MNNEIKPQENLVRLFEPTTEDDELLLEAMATLWRGVETTIHTLNQMEDIN